MNVTPDSLPLDIRALPPGEFICDELRDAVRD